MRRLAALALLPLLTGSMPQHTSEPPVPGDTMQAPDQHAAPVGRLTIIRACGSAPPWTLRGWWKEADAIVRVRVDSQFAYDEVDGVGTEPFISTELDVAVLDVFKPHPRVGVVGAMMTIAHPGGTLMRRDGPETHVTNAFPPPANGTEWFLFLRWDEGDRRFWISYLEHGALQVQHDGSLVPTTAADFTVRLRGTISAETLADRLRALADGAQ